MMRPLTRLDHNQHLIDTHYLQRDMILALDSITHATRELSYPLTNTTSHVLASRDTLMIDGRALSGI